MAGGYTTVGLNKLSALADRIMVFRCDTLCGPVRPVVAPANRGPPRMAVRAQHGALCDLFLDDVPFIRIAHQGSDIVALCSSNVMKLQHNRVILAAINTRMRLQILEY